MLFRNDLCEGCPAIIGETMGNSSDNKINCYKCAHFAVSWDPNFPRSCKLFGFKTAGLPSVRVFESSGEECAGFRRKTDWKKAGQRGAAPR